MVTLLITSFLILAFLAIAIYFWQKPASRSEVEALRPPPGRGLFIEEPTETQLKAEAALETTAKAAARRRELIELAAAGEKSTLLEAYNSEDAELYDETLNSLVAATDSDPKLLSLLSYVASHELRVNKELAEKAIDSYQHAPDRGSTARMLHIAALSNDAAVYQRAVEIALKFWRAGRLSEISAPELRSILEGEFWVLSSSTRSSGSGFLLKRALRNARRELEAAND